MGVQSTVALDTVVGAPISGERVGYDLILGAGTDESALGHSDLILA